MNSLYTPSAAASTDTAVSTLGCHSYSLRNPLNTIKPLKETYFKVKGEQAEQTRLIKKLQRKLLLVTKERDSVKQE